MTKIRSLILAGGLAFMLSVGLAAGACGDDDDDDGGNGTEPTATEEMVDEEPTEEMVDEEPTAAE